MHSPAFSLRFCVLMIGLLVLAACAGPAERTYSYNPPSTPGGRLCTNQCHEAKGYCTQNCALDQRRCVGKIQAQALQDYDKYTREQFTSHQPIELRPRDFERTGACDSAYHSCTDDCEGHYQMCYEGCGGTVSATTSCQFLCF